MYWLTSSTFSICNVLVLRIPGVREALGIVKPVTHSPPVNKDKRSWNESK